MSRLLLLPVCLLLSAPAMARPEQRIRVGDGGLGDLLGMIESRQADMAQELDVQEHALGALDAMGCKAIGSRLGSLSALFNHSSETLSRPMQCIARIRLFVML